MSCSNCECCAKGEAIEASQELKDMFVRQLRAQPYSKITEWDVYKLKPTGMFKHHSLFFTPRSSPGDGFTAEIRVVDGKVFVCSFTFKRVPLSRLTHLGSVNRSIEDIADLAVSCAQTFGKFHGTLNNCQNYANLLSDRLGISTEWTDVATAGVVGAVGVAVIGAAIGAVVYSRNKKK